MRRSARIAFRLPVFIRVGSQEQACEIIEVGKGGVFVATELSAPLRQLVQISTLLPDGSEFQVNGMIARVINAEEAKELGVASGLGIQFYGLGNTATHRWQGFVDSQLAEAVTPSDTKATDDTLPPGVHNISESSGLDADLLSAALHDERDTDVIKKAEIQGLTDTSDQAAAQATGKGEELPRGPIQETLPLGEPPTPPRAPRRSSPESSLRATQRIWIGTTRAGPSGHLEPSRPEDDGDFADDEHDQLGGDTLLDIPSRSASKPKAKAGEGAEGKSQDLIRTRAFDVSNLASLYGAKVGPSKGEATAAEEAEEADVRRSAREIAAKTGLDPSLVAAALAGGQESRKKLEAPQTEEPQFRPRRPTEPPASSVIRIIGSDSPRDLSPRLTTPLGKEAEPAKPADECLEPSSKTSLKETIRRTPATPDEAQDESRPSQEIERSKPYRPPRPPKPAGCETAESSMIHIIGTDDSVEIARVGAKRKRRDTNEPQPKTSDAPPEAGPVKPKIEGKPPRADTQRDLEPPSLEKSADGSEETDSPSVEESRPSTEFPSIEIDVEEPLDDETPPEAELAAPSDETAPPDEDKPTGQIQLGKSGSSRSNEAKHDPKRIPETPSTDDGSPKAIVAFDLNETQRREIIPQRTPRAAPSEPPPWSMPQIPLGGAPRSMPGHSEPRPPQGVPWDPQTGLPVQRQQAPLARVQQPPAGYQQGIQRYPQQLPLPGVLAGRQQGWSQPAHMLALPPAMGLAPSEPLAHVVYRLMLPTAEALEGFAQAALRSGGVFVRTRDLRPIGTPAVVVVVHPMSGDEFHLPGEIEHSGIQNRGVGVRLFGVTQRTVSEFRNFITLGIPDNDFIDVESEAIDSPLNGSAIIIATTTRADREDQTGSIPRDTREINLSQVEPLTRKERP